MPKNAKRIDIILLIATPSKKINGVKEKIVTNNLSIKFKFFDISFLINQKAKLRYHFELLTYF